MSASISASSSECFLLLTLVDTRQKQLANPHLFPWWAANHYAWVSFLFVTDDANEGLRMTMSFIAGYGVFLPFFHFAPKTHQPSIDILISRDALWSESISSFVINELSKRIEIWDFSVKRRMLLSVDYQWCQCHKIYPVKNRKPWASAITCWSIRCRIWTEIKKNSSVFLGSMRSSSDFRLFILAEGRRVECDTYRIYHGELHRIGLTQT